MTLQNIYFIWVGEKDLSPLQFLSFKSFSNSGKNLILYTDNLKRIIPKEIPIELRSYKDIDPHGEIIRYGSGTGHRRGSPVLYTNLLRYLLLARYGGWYADSDVVFLKDDLPDNEFWVGYETQNMTNNAILYTNDSHKYIFKEAAHITANDKLGKHVWGRTGPQLVNWLISKYSLNKFIRPINEAYAVSWQNASDVFFEEENTNISKRTSQSPFLHLYTSIYADMGIPEDLAPPKNSWLSDKFDEFDITKYCKGRMKESNVKVWKTNYLCFRYYQSQNKARKNIFSEQKYINL